MKKTIVLFALFAGGVAASFAIASPSRSLIGQTLTGQTGTNGKVTICHRTGSQTHPWVKITVSPAALPAHERHGDQDVVNGACPSASGATGPNGPAATTTGTTTHGKRHGPHGKSGHDHGKSGKQHGKSGQHHGKSSAHKKNG